MADITVVPSSDDADFDDEYDTAVGEDFLTPNPRFPDVKNYGKLASNALALQKLAALNVQYLSLNFYP